MIANSSDDRLLGADFMRAAACLVVLFHHLAQRLDQGEIATPLEIFRIFSSNGTFGVAIFFVLSGFLLARPFWRALDGGKPMSSLRTYAVRRAARILPGFWLALTVTFVASFTIFNSRLDGELWLRFVAGFLLVADWHWITFFPVDINGPLWSISFEATSYVLLPVCFALLFSVGASGWWARAIWLGVIALILAGHWLIASFVTIDEARRGWHFGLPGGANIWMPEYNPLAFFAMFAVGSFAAGFQVRWAKRRD
ncbi:MAG TPA: acyltransferase [Rhizobiaceae bacterium]|nr:acyltransferase [Rhizobiaceae bacterium]